jgi:hypothetical protein
MIAFAGLSSLAATPPATQLLVASSPYSAADPGSATQLVDPAKSGDYRSGRWEYRVQFAKIELPRTQAWSDAAKNWEWRSAELFVDGKPLSHPRAGDGLLTPWGPMQWTSNPGEAGTSSQVGGWFPLPFSVVADPKAPAEDGPGVKQNAERIDFTRDGVCKSGKWEFRYHIAHAEFKARGGAGALAHSDTPWGELLFDGKPVAEPRLQDCVYTPWGMIQWQGEQSQATDTPGRGHGWTPINCPLLPDPAGVPNPAAKAQN